MENVPRSEARKIERQHRCPHTLFKCPQCGKFKDNIFNEYQIRIEIQSIFINYLEELLSIHRIPFNSCGGSIESGIMDIWKTEKVEQYARRTRLTDDQDLLLEDGTAY